MSDFRVHQASNRRKTILLLASLFSLIVIVAYAAMITLGQTGVGILPVAVGIALVSVWGSYWSSDKIVLRMTGARLIDHDSAPQLFNLVEELTMASGLPMPKVAIVEDDAPNAFATGRNPEHAVIAFTTGILKVMDREQLQGVTAHELAHVANRDTLVSAVAATTAGAIALISDMMLRVTMFGGGRERKNENSHPLLLVFALLAIVLSPIAAALLRSAVSRKREALADATAVEFTRNPTGLRRALETLEQDSTVVAQKSHAVAHVWIESPLDAGSVNKLFATHPPLRERIAILEKLEGLR